VPVVDRRRGAPEPLGTPLATNGEGDVGRTERTVILMSALSVLVLSTAVCTHADSSLPAPPCAQEPDAESGATGSLPGNEADSLASADELEPAVPDTAAGTETPWMPEFTGFRVDSAEDSLSWEPKLGEPWAKSDADSQRARDAGDAAAPVALEDPASSSVVRYGAGGTILPSRTRWKRYPTIGVSVTSSKPGFGWYFHTGLSALVLRETERAEHLLWMIDFGYARKWSEGRGFIGLGVSLRSAGSFFAEKKAEGEEEETDEDEQQEWWWPIKDLREFAVLPQAYVRVPLVETLALEVCYALVRENRTLVGGLDVKLTFRL
jgi:hypothetical protein